MVYKSYKVSVPGSLMLMGEHAVLAGKQAMVCAVDQRLYIELILDESKVIKISDTRLGKIELPIDRIQIQQPFQFVLSAIKSFEIKQGFSLHIKSDFSSILGLGSSAAVTVATLAVLSAWLKPMTNDQIFTLAKEIHAGGSGADLAASVYGGVLSYNLESLKQLPIIPGLTAVYCGYKKPTPEVIAIVKQAIARQPNAFAKIFSAMHECVNTAVIAIKNQNWTDLGEMFNMHHYMQGALGVSNSLLDSIANRLRECPGIYGAKISGAGLGDCVIGLGTIEDKIFANDQQQFQVVIDSRGIIYDSN